MHMQPFLENYWFVILSILLGLIVAYVSYQLQKKGCTAASEERKQRATTELLDVIESYIINKQRLSEHVIDDLIHASERDHAVALRPTCTVVSLLQDVALRFQRSRHLDIPQKSQYSEIIEQFIREIKEHRDSLYPEDFGKSLSTKLLKLRQFLPADQKTEGEQTLSTAASLVQQQRAVLNQMKRAQEPQMISTALLLGCVMALTGLLINSNHWDTVSGLLILGALLVLLLGALAFINMTRIIRIMRHRSRGELKTAKSGAG